MMVISSVQVRRDRSDFWEGIKAHNATVTCAIFAPNPEAIIKSENDEDNISRSSVVTVSYSYMFNWVAFVYIYIFVCIFWTAHHNSRSDGRTTQKELRLRADQRRL